MLITEKENLEEPDLGGKVHTLNLGHAEFNC